MNTYGFKEQDYLKTWLEETRDWREHEHTHITEVEKNINANVDAAETAIISKIEEHNNYVVNTIRPKIEAVQTTVNENKNTLQSIWDKIKDAVFKFN